MHLWNIFSANARATFSIKSIEHRRRLLLSDRRVLLDIPARSQTSKVPSLSHTNLFIASK